MTTTEVDATLSAFAAPPRPAVATMVHRTPGERMLRVVAAVGACWASALAAVFIPIAHFVLVPALVVTGIIMGVSRAREEWAIVGVRGECPRCEWAEGFS
ncbi:MAG TPA: hypothetical protein VML54_11705 [Candidatus Limnocylindrales bacterium]|nr:hypothetical protein [Candidatus Limnocylindrales bacterium]